MGREAIEGLRFLASLPRAGAGHKKTQPFNWIHSRLFNSVDAITLDLVIVDPNNGLTLDLIL